jgi:hypothetical protein
VNKDTRVSEPMMGLLAVAAGRDAPGNPNGRTLYHHPRTDVWYAGGDVVSRTARAMLSRDFIRRTPHYGWLPTICGDTPLHVYELTPAGWAAAARQLGGAEKAKELLGPVPS